MQVADRFTNWHRDDTVTQNFTWSFNEAKTSEFAPQSYVEWRFDMTFIQLWAANVTRAGPYTYTVKYHSPQGLQDFVPVLENGTFQETGTVVVRPGPVSTMSLSSSGRHVAGENFWYLIKFADDFGNLAVLRTSYVAWRMPFYSTADQNLLLVQVDVQPMQCADCVAPRTTMEFVQDTFGVVKLNMHTAMAGLYLITVTCNLTQVPLKSTLVHEVFSTGRPDLQSSVVTLNNSNVVAGTSPAYQITLYDEYANQIPLGFLSPQQNVTLTVDLPNNSSRVIPVSPGFDPNIIFDTVAGTHQVTLGVGNTTGEAVAYFVSPSPATSPYFSIVVGSGVGIVTPHGPSGIPQVYAGVHHYLDAYGYDAWNNSQRGIDPGFWLGSDFVAECAFFNRTGHKDTGKTRFEYVLTKTGNYTLEVYTRELDLVHTQPLHVLPHPYIHNVMVNGSLPDVITAGDSLDVTVLLLDRFSNLITPEACQLYLKGGAWTKTMTLQPDIINGIPRFLVMLVSAGIFNMTLLAVGATTSRHMLQSITVVPGVVHAYSSFIQGAIHALLTKLQWTRHMG
ncbi:hypothetical protein OEZ86_014358 [Tetradesmus obliquus]|nr:hypothetical protein OEZ86_014358 [Tetradesmus obliquus]